MAELVGGQHFDGTARLVMVAAAVHCIVTALLEDAVDGEPGDRCVERYLCLVEQASIGRSARHVQRRKAGRNDTLVVRPSRLKARTLVSPCTEREMRAPARCSCSHW